MSSNPLLTFISPPLPYFIESNRTIYQPGSEHPSRRNLGVFDLLFVHSGTLYIGEENRSWTVGPGGMLILRPDCMHYSIQPCKEETIIDWVHFQTAGPWEELLDNSCGTLSGDYYSHAIRLPKAMTLPSPEEAIALLDKLQEAATGTSHAAFWQRQHWFLGLLQLMDESWRTDSAKAPIAVAEEAAAYLKLHYRKTVTNRMLGDALGLHPNYIARCMSEVFNCTPQQYLHAYRMDQAKLLLMKTNWPIARIAEETGFKQTPHFSRSFSESVGQAPLLFRKKFTGGTVSRRKTKLEGAD
ncbi:HTH-type transcriptional activator RhaS [Paenibacillus plantiphilus]|uniref:HTH-type transcriptional activator RhaS n=1 Tax=Paenibacillus plantiphilus TaxID=2905650 RepID=A0ABM9CA21_9BACL|nr:helix-turn-helix transcriptional regulator [Paenibacillus plantiphilus]CAH1206907.1 HTH-type transcriptional activator RhaS [Paenibacillus plantiphilus]